jgi:hypothetical protein
MFLSDSPTRLCSTGRKKMLRCWLFVMFWQRDSIKRRLTVLEFTQNTEKCLHSAHGDAKNDQKLHSCTPKTASKPMSVNIAPSVQSGEEIAIFSQDQNTTAVNVHGFLQMGRHRSPSFREYKQCGCRDCYGVVGSLK